MPENKCDTCVECFKKHQNPRLKKETCIDYIQSYEKIQALRKATTYVYKGTT